jgi:hypothetical protein
MLKLLHILKVVRNLFVTALILSAMIGFFLLITLTAPYSYIPFVIIFIVLIWWIYTIVADELG